MKIIFWLGNPWPQYRQTRHNAGFLAVDFLQKSWQASEFEATKFHALKSEILRNGEKILLIKPLTFMNLSGNAVSQICHFYKISPKDIIVISDDIDMDFGKVRAREKGSHGGQNGLRDIITKLGTNEFLRIKIGVGRHEKMSVSDWVLSRFTSEELFALESEIFPKVEILVWQFL